jgi:glyoxylase-like metal-dependent hydrolase (beta-lactamase superfamily II)
MLLSASAWAAPRVTAIGPDLYAYISDNDGSANSTFLVGRKGILVVDTGLDATEGDKLLREIRKVSRLPVLYVINTHYHPDHQGGNSVVVQMQQQSRPTSRGSEPWHCCSPLHNAI